VTLEIPPIFLVVMQLGVPLLLSLFHLHTLGVRVGKHIIAGVILQDLGNQWKRTRQRSPEIIKESL
jgi:hypothetical protein